MVDDGEPFSFLEEQEHLSLTHRWVGSGWLPDLRSLRLFEAPHDSK